MCGFLEACFNLCLKLFDAIVYPPHMTPDSFDLGVHLSGMRNGRVDTSMYWRKHATNVRGFAARTSLLGRAVPPKCHTVAVLLFHSRWHSVEYVLAVKLRAFPAFAEKPFGVELVQSCLAKLAYTHLYTTVNYAHRVCYPALADRVCSPAPTEYAIHALAEALERI
eukprot:222678-Rhodomonas_salina.1